MSIWIKIKEGAGRFFKKTARSFKKWASRWKADETDKEKTFFDRHFVMMRRKPGFLVSVLTTTVLFFLIFFMMVGVAGVGAFLGVARGYLDATPELDIREIEDQSQTSYIYDKDGNLVTPYYGFENRQSVPIEEIPEMLQNAFIAIEDVRFRAHNGIDLKRFFGAIVHNLSNDTVQGGSTITQQLIKQTLLSPEQSYKRKIQEMYLAMELEKTYTKDQILEEYLNLIPLGGSCYGVKAAAENYFGKELNELTLQECAMLAGITRNPWRYDPRKNIYERDKAYETVNRTNLVLSEMYENGYITKEEYEAAKFDEKNPENNTFTVLEKGTSSDYPWKYFIECAIEETRDQLMAAYGWEGEEGIAKANEMIYAGGLHIYTTMDTQLQEQAEQAVYNYEKLPPLRNSIDTLSKNGVPQPQAAVMVMDYHTGQIRAIVGGKQPPTGKKQLNRAVDSRLALGSAIKPLSVYAPFIEMGYPGGIILDNIPAAVEGWIAEDKAYPYNYEGPNDFTGPVTVRHAITKSLNIIAAEIVCERITPEVSAQALRDFGIRDEDVTVHPSDLALGSHGNRMIDVIGGYGTIANKGVYLEPITVLRVLDRNGKEIFSRNNQIKREVLKESTAFILTEWMQGVVQGGTTTVNLYNEAGQKIPVAGKTGTNNKFRGCYFAGFTPYYVATVWIGHDDFMPEFKSGSTGGVYAAPLWAEIMTAAHKNLEPKNFYDSVPSGLKQYTVCGVSGKTVVPGLCDVDPLHPPVTEWFPEGAEPLPEDVCDIHISANICAYSGVPMGRYCPEEYSIPRSAIVLRPESRYQLLTDEEIQKYLPGAVRSSNLAGQEYECPVHTERWWQREQRRREMRNAVDSLISQVRAYMNSTQYGPLMTSQEKKDLNQLIEQLEDLMKEGDRSPPGPGEPYLTFLDTFDEDATKKKMDQLRKRCEDIINRIDYELAYYHTLTISVRGKGTVTGGGSYPEGEVIEITATAKSGWHFVMWLGGVADTSDPTTTITMGSGNIHITAVFEQDSSSSTPGPSPTPEPNPTPEPSPVSP